MIYNILSNPQRITEIHDTRYAPQNKKKAYLTG